MYLGISAGIIFPSILLTWGVLALIKKFQNGWGMKPVIVYSLGCLASILVPLVSLIVMIVAFTITDYHGECYGFTDGVWPCPYSEFLANSIPFLIGCYVAWGYIYHMRKREFIIQITIYCVMASITRRKTLLHSQ